MSIAEWIAVASAVVVAVQSWYTRAAAKAASAASKTSNDALAIARQSGHTAERALVVSQDMAKEALRARLDASAPALSVTAERPADVLFKMDKNEMGTPEKRPVRLGHQFDPQRNAETILIQPVKWRLTNTSDLHLHVSLTYVEDGVKVQNKPVVIAPGDYLEGIHEFWDVFPKLGEPELFNRYLSQSHPFSVFHRGPRAGASASDTWTLDGPNWPLSWNPSVGTQGRVYDNPRGEVLEVRHERTYWALTGERIT